MKMLIIAALAPFVIMLWLAGIYHVAFWLFGHEGTASGMVVFLGIIPLMVAGIMSLEGLRMIYRGAVIREETEK